MKILFSVESLQAFISKVYLHYIMLSIAEFGT